MDYKKSLFRVLHLEDTAPTSFRLTPPFDHSLYLSGGLLPNLLSHHQHALCQVLSDRQGKLRSSRNNRRLVLLRQTQQHALRLWHRINLGRLRKTNRCARSRLAHSRKMS